jgi:uncharacterized protein
MLRFSPNPNRAHMIPWFEWSDEAFRLAQEQNKPVMLFLSAFWCGYCQRMDQEAFSETENIALLKAYFVSIRVENGQRPDIDSRYNQNGWPTLIFMTPQGDPIIATNYLPANQFEDLLLRVYIGHQQTPAYDDPAGSTGENIAPPAPAPASMITGPNKSSISEIAGIIMNLADTTNGGYGQGQKFIHAEANDFLLVRYQETKDSRYLDQVRLTLDRMRAGPIHDRDEGAYFRTTTGADWSRPHREKLLAEQAGLVRNCLQTFKITKQPVYAEMAQEIVGYLNRKLYDAATGSFYGCEDFLRTFADEQSPLETFFTIFDKCIYTDANAQTIAAYLDASVTLRNADYKTTALGALEFLWDHARGDDGAMYHCFDGGAQVHGLLNDQTHMGLALLMAYGITGEEKYLERAKELTTFILTRLKNPAGGYYDICTPGAAYLKLRLTLIEQNGPAASFFLALADATGDTTYRAAALWAFVPFTENFAEYGIYAAALGQALGEALQSPPKPNL